jgi:hypothetical protein
MPALNLRPRANWTILSIPLIMKENSHRMMKITAKIAGVSIAAEKPVTTSASISELEQSSVKVAISSSVPGIIETTCISFSGVVMIFLATIAPINERIATAEMHISLTREFFLKIMLQSVETARNDKTPTVKENESDTVKYLRKNIGSG